MQIIVLMVAACLMVAAAALFLRRERNSQSRSMRLAAERVRQKRLADARLDLLRRSQPVPRASSSADPRGEPETADGL